MSQLAQKSADADAPLKGHSFDGIEEYDKKLPNWWLWTLYGAIAFSFFYWFYFHWVGNPETSVQRLERQLSAIALAAASSGGAELDDTALWKMSRDEKIVSAGRKTFLTTCVSCHGVDLKGGIGVNLTDKDWVHGGKPTEVVRTVTKGVLDKGMPSWGPVLGKMRVAQVAAFVLSHHAEGEEIHMVPSPTKSAGAAAPAPAAAP